MASAAEKRVGLECAATYSILHAFACVCRRCSYTFFLLSLFSLPYINTKNVVFLFSTCTAESRSGMMTSFNTSSQKKAAQATFKSIRSLVPLLDRVLVQRFKPETVRFLLPFYVEFLNFLFFKCGYYRKRRRGSSSRLRRRRTPSRKRP